MIPFELRSLTDLDNASADTIIDVRAPMEFAEDHLPGAINLPVLSDAERAEIGTMYTQQSPFLARKAGAALVARNTATHLQGPLADKAGNWQPLVYCWRGGQRSGAFATILNQIGWRVRVLKGGYRSYRRQVVQTLYDTPLPHRLMLVDGGTGTAKTRLLQHLEETGAQVLDLEGMAEHRGSLFGATGRAQPGQKLFETRLAHAMSRHDPAQITWVEAESSKIGARILPPTLWSAMQGAARIRVTAPLSARVSFLCEAYDDLMTDTSHLHDRIDQLRPYHPADVISDWHNQATGQNWPALAEGLMTAHYDPRYTKSAAAKPAAIRTFDLPDLNEATLASLAQDLTTQFR
jgi:tRNA 2-selenouridine synthase